MSYCSPGFNLLGEIVRRLSGISLDDFAHRRIFDPLGMNDTSYILRDSARERVVRRRPLDPPPFGLDSPEYHKEPWPEAGVLSIAMDMAVFGQMLLNGGIYGGERILSSVSVREMTRNQIPGVSAQFGEELFPEAGWGYGWEVKGNKKSIRDGSLTSPATFSHGGSGGVWLWIDPVYEIVGVYFSVSPVRAPFQPDWCVDLFMNAVTAAVIEA
jgi:CubicO group peptidase (beta-lactamase class C family)